MDERPLVKASGAVAERCTTERCFIVHFAEGKDSLCTCDNAALQTYSSKWPLSHARGTGPPRYKGTQKGRLLTKAALSKATTNFIQHLALHMLHRGFKAIESCIYLARIGRSKQDLNRQLFC